MKKVISLILIISLNAVAFSQRIGIYYNKDNGLTEGKVHTTHMIPDKMMWIGTEKGITCYDGKDFHKYPQGENGLGKSNGFNCLFQDHSNNLWAYGVKLKQYVIYAELDHRFVNEAVKTSMDVKKAVDAIDGLSLFKNGKWTSFSGNPNLPKNINYVIEDFNGNIWATSSKMGVSIFKNDSWTKYDKSNGFPLSKIEHILADNQGGMWFSGAQGVCRYKNGTFELKKEVNKTKLNDIESIFITSNKLIWFQTKSGLVLFENEKWKTFGKKEIASSKMTKPYTDKDNKTWIGTEKGLLYYDGVKLSRYLNDRNIRDIIEDDNSNLWVATDKGPAMLANDTFQEYYDFKSSIFGIKFFLINGKIWFTSVREAGFFDGNKFVIFPYSDYSVKNAVINGNFRYFGTDKKGNIYTEFNTMKNAFVCKFDGQKWTKYKVPNNSRMLSGAIYDTYKDDNSDFWLITTLGVMKFDGENFKMIDENLDGLFAHRMYDLVLGFNFKRQWVTGYYDGIYMLPDGIEAYDK